VWALVVSTIRLGLIRPKSRLNPRLSGENSPLNVVIDPSLPKNRSTEQRQCWDPPARVTTEPMRLHGHQVGTTCPKCQVALQTLLRRPITHYLVFLPDADMPQETVYTRQGFPLKDERSTVTLQSSRG